MNIKKTVFALGTLIFGFGFFSSANAQVTTVPVTQGGVTCQKVIGGTYPEDGHIFRCTSSNSLNNEIQSRPKTIMTGYGTNTQPGLDMKEKFAAAGVTFYAFNDAIAAESFLRNIVPTEPQRQQWFADHDGEGGFSTDTADKKVVVFKAYGVTNSYPTTVSLTTTTFSHTIAHEMGHNFDFLSRISGILPSSTTEFNRVALIDDNYLNTQTSGNVPPNDYASIKAAYGFYLNKDPSKAWAELFAETFAKKTHGSADTNPGQGADGIIQTYYACTRRYVEFFLANNRAPVNNAVPVEYNTARCNTP